MLYRILLHRDPFDSRSILVYLIIKDVSSLLLIPCYTCATLWSAFQFLRLSWAGRWSHMEPTYLKSSTARCCLEMRMFSVTFCSCTTLCCILESHCFTLFLSKLQGFRLIAFPFLFVFSNTPSLLLTSCMSCPCVPTLNGCTYCCIDDDKPIMYINHFSLYVFIMIL